MAGGRSLHEIQETRAGGQKLKIAQGDELSWTNVQ